LVVVLSAPVRRWIEAARWRLPDDPSAVTLQSLLGGRHARAVGLTKPSASRATTTSVILGVIVNQQVLSSAHNLATDTELKLLTIDIGHRHLPIGHDDL
jgi:hypothetical protein